MGELAIIRDKIKQENKIIPLDEVELKKSLNEFRLKELAIFSKITIHLAC